MNKRKFATFFIALAGVLWGCIALFVRPLNDRGLVSMDIVFLRAAVTALIMLVFLLIYNRSLLKIKIKDIWVFLGTGIASMVFFNFCYFKTIETTTLSVASILLYTAPAFVMILSFFLFKEKFTWTKILSLVLTLGGLVLVTGVFSAGGSIAPLGILTGLGAGLGYALYSIFGRYALQKGYNTFTITFYTFVIATIGSVFFADVPKVVSVTCESGMNAFLCIGFSLICTIAPYFLYTLGLMDVSNSTASIIATIEPIAATLIGIVVFREKILIPGIIGMVLVIGGIVLSGIFEEKKQT